LFSIFAGSVSATLTWVLLRLMGRTDRTQLIHFGPFLALGAVGWMFYGPDLLDWYLDRYRWR
jgi:leader peptidase (prepilin peptidase)/N-methyltransferase